MQGTVDFAVIGGGAAGMAAAVTAAACGDRVILLEKSSALGRKIAASGNGRCNLMNSGELRYFGNDRFAGEVFGNCPQGRLIQYWQNLGIRLSEENDGRLYPCTFHSSTVTDAYKTALKTAEAEVRLQTEVKRIRKEDGLFQIQTASTLYKASRILIACGGSACPKLGGTDSGYTLLSGFGHSIVPTKPALCPLTTDGRSISGLSGIRVKCGVHLKDSAGKTIREEKGEVLFTDRGISGICVMQTARFAEPGFTVALDLTGRIFADRDELIRALLRRQKQIPACSPETLLNGILVPKLSYAVMKQAGIEMKGRSAGDLTENEIRAAADQSSHYSLTVTGSRGMDEAQVTAGGADCGEFRPDTMESRLVPGLHAGGEVLNTDGDCGGFNLMFATACGLLAGLNGREETAL